MCNPIVGALVSAVGSLAGAAQQSGVAKAQAQIARNAALVERQRAQLEAERQRTARRQAIAAVRANALARGISDNGSIAESIIADLANSEHDIAITRFGREAQARQYEASANISKAKAAGGLFGGGIGAIAPLVNTVTIAKPTKSSRTQYLKTE